MEKNKNMAENIAQETNNLVNKVFDKVDNAAEAGRVIANQGAGKTQKLLEMGVDKVNNLQDFTSKQYDKCTHTLSRCLKDKPIHSTFAIAGIGAVLALWLTRSRKDRY